MLALKMLVGPDKDKVFKLEKSRCLIGRSSKCDIVLENAGVSKEHADIHILAAQMIVQDLNSSNGTFVNGLRVQKSEIKIGDRLGIAQFIFELIKYEAPMVVSTERGPQTAAEEPPANKNLTGWQAKIQNYIDVVAMPGIYKLTDLFEYKTVLFSFAILYILIMTLLSIIPMNQITKESIENESRRRAQTVARALANANEKVLRFGDYSKFSTDFVMREDGIEDVYIVSKEGMILAPPERAGARPKETAFIRKIQGQAKEISSTLDNNKVAAAFPIVAYDPDLQQNIAKAHAVVVFNVSSLEFDDGRAFSLFIQMLILALIVGFVLFFIVFKLIEYPLHKIHDELDHSIKEGRDHIQLNLKLPALQELLITLNSLLTRSMNPTISTERQTLNRDLEMQNLCQMVGYPCFILNKHKKFLAINQPFESLLGISRIQLIGNEFTYLPDQALQKNIEELFERATQQPQIPLTDKIEISGHVIINSCLSSSDAEYFIYTFTPDGGVS
jgi:hypothetical protein